MDMMQINEYGGYMVSLVKPGAELSPKLICKAKKRMKKDIFKLVKKLCDRDEFWIVKRTPASKDILDIFSHPLNDTITIGWKLKAPQIKVHRKVSVTENGNTTEYFE
jgi:hypothetical protein